MSVPSLESQLQGWRDRSANYEDHITELDDTIATMRGQYTDLILCFQHVEAELQEQVQRCEEEQLRAVQAEDERDTMRDVAEEWHWCATHTANDRGEVRGRWAGTTLMHYLSTIGRKNP